MGELRDDNMASLRFWSDGQLDYELSYQTADVIGTWSVGACGHAARGGGFCAACLRLELGSRGRDERC